MTHPTHDNTGDAAVPAMTDADIEAMVAERQPYAGEIRVGMVFIWEPDNPRSYCRVVVTDIKCSGPEDGPGGERWIRSSEKGDGLGAWNEESRFREAVVPVDQAMVGQAMADLPTATGHLISAAWMREQVRIAVCNIIGGTDYYDDDILCEIISDAIRATPLPTDADLLAEAMKLPEVAALVEAARRSLTDVNPLWVPSMRAALVPFTAVKETP